MKRTTHSLWRAAVLILAATLITCITTHRARGEEDIAKRYKVNVNYATVQQLQVLEGIDAEKADKIIANRPYTRPRDLTEKGVLGEKLTENIAPFIIFNQVDLNNGTRKELEELPYVGPVYSKKIIANRPYRSPADLSKIGFSEERIAAIAPLLIFPGQPAPVVVVPAPVVVVPAPAPIVVVPTPEPARVEPKVDPKAMPTEPKSIVKGGLIDLNTASIHELEELPGVTAAEAQRIIDKRPYKKADELSKVGFNDKRISEITPRLTFEMATPISDPKAKTEATPAAEPKKTETKPEATPAAEPKKTETTPAVDPKAKPTGTAAPEATETKEKTPVVDAKTLAAVSHEKPLKGDVWVNTASGVYHKEGDQYYGKTKVGKYMTEEDAKKLGFHAPK